MPFIENAGGGSGGSGTVTNVSSANTGIAVANPTTTPTLTLATLDVIAADGPPAANWSNNAKKITGVAVATAATDAASLANTLDQFGAPAANVAFNAKKITGLAVATAATDASSLANTLDQFGAPAASVAFNSQRITGLANGTAPTNAAALGQVASRLPFASWIPASGKHETLPRALIAGGSTALTSGTLYLLALPTPLQAGVTYTSISFVSNAAANGPTHQWFTLVQKSNLQTLRSTTDDTTTAWGGSSIKTLNLSSTYTPAVDTDAYVGIMVAATVAAISVRTDAEQLAISGLTPIMYGTSNTGATTPLADGTTVTALTDTGFGFYGLVS